MGQRQFLHAANKREEKLLRRVAQAKDGILKLNPDFHNDVERLRAELKPYDVNVYLHPETFSEEELEKAKSDHADSFCAAWKFAHKWHLPAPRDPSVDPSYLLEDPYSNAPWISGTQGAVRRHVCSPLPVLVLAIDIRFPKEMLKERIDDEIQRRQREWTKAGYEIWSLLEKEVAKAEKMLTVHELRLTKERYKAIGEKIGVGERQAQRLKEELDEIVREGKHWAIATFTHLDQDDLRAKSFQAFAAHPEFSEAVV